MSMDVPQGGETQPTAENLLDVGFDFLHHFGVEVSPVQEADQFLTALQQLDPRYEGGRELVRWELEKDQKQWPDNTKAVIMRTAEGMRMLDLETPLDGTFDVAIVLGGARQANLDRMRYAVQCILNGRANVDHLIVAGSTRQLKEDEQQNTANYAPDALTEFDLCAAAAKVVARENPGLVTAQMMVDIERAGTPDVIDSVLQNVLGISSDAPSIAAVTTQIYQASTALDLRRVAQVYGPVETYAAGCPSDPSVIAARTPATYLSEILRTLRAVTHSLQATA